MTTPPRTDNPDCSAIHMLDVSAVHGKVYAALGADAEAKVFRSCCDGLSWSECLRQHRRYSDSLLSKGQISELRKMHEHPWGASELAQMILDMLEVGWPLHHLGVTSRGHVVSELDCPNKRGPSVLDQVDQTVWLDPEGRCA